MSVARENGDRGRERFPGLREDIGEDPARYLDVPMFRPPGADGSSPLSTAMARIRGIDQLAVANAWLAVERRLDRGPRERVVDALQERIEYLEGHGSRPSDIPTTDGPDRYRRRDVREDVPCEYSGFDGQLVAGESREGGGE
jgi:hypothetical protein